MLRHRGYQLSSTIEGPQQVSGPLVVLTVTLLGLRTDPVGGLTEQIGQQLGGTHAYPAVNPPGVDGMVHVVKRAQPRGDVQVVGVYQGAIDVEQHSACHGQLASMPGRVRTRT
jgi:hypothetical protein